MATEQNRLVVKGALMPFSLTQRIEIITSDDLASIEQPTRADKEFGGILKTGESVQFIPINRDNTEKDKLLSTYAAISGSVNIQNLFGVFTNNDSQYAVMQQLKGENVPFVVLSEAFKENDKASVAKASRLQRLSLCYQVSQTVAYLHSLQVNLVVKVISDSSIYVRKVDEELIPVMTNLEYSRLVCPGNIRLICRFYFIPITLLTIKNMTHLNMVLKNRGPTVTARTCGGSIFKWHGVNLSLGLLIWQ